MTATKQSCTFSVKGCPQTFGTNDKGELIVYPPPKVREPGDITLLREILETLRSIERKMISLSGPKW